MLIIIVVTICLQLCSGLDETAVGSCAQLVFAPVSVSVSEDMPLISSGFRVVPLDSSLAVCRHSFTFM